MLPCYGDDKGDNGDDNGDDDGDDNNDDNDVTCQSTIFLLIRIRRTKKTMISTTHGTTTTTRVTRLA